MAQVVKLAVTLALALTGCSSCTPAVAPAPPSDSQIFDELVEAGCMKADDSGLAAVSAERALNPPKAWMNCLAGGGTVAGCAVPCQK
jgi:hypothetical protein